MDKAEERAMELASIKNELEFYRTQPPPEFMVEAVERRKAKLRERLAELGPEPAK